MAAAPMPVLGRCYTSAAMTAPAVIVDALCSLLEAEQSSLFRSVADGSPYLGRASVDVRKAVAYVAAADDRRSGELWRMIESLGGQPRPRAVRPADQMLAYLSVKFILPKLVEAKELLAQRYRNALAAVADADGPAVELLRRHLGEHAGEAVVLQQAAEAVAAS
ncbi:MAG: hypothetical protein JWO31_2203 [Phycisphaerales bacterium]|nr:hypothetical protein [Phycisphaerales bacterium]